MARLRTTTLLVDLGAQAKVPSTVFDYEIPVMEAIHGQELGSGFLQPVSTGFVDVDLDSADDLYAILQARYAGRNREAVRSVYPNRHEFLRALNKCVADEDDEDDEKPARKAGRKAGRKAAAPDPEGDSDEQESPQG